jgi:hypothetical protein
MRHKQAPAANPLSRPTSLDRAKPGVILVKLTKEAAMSAAIVNPYEAKTSL